MDITEFISATEIRARIFSCRAELKKLKDSRKRHYKEINAAKKLIRAIESSIDRGVICELSNLEADSVRSYLLFLRETLIDLEYFWKIQNNFYRILHKKIDALGERVYL